MTTTLPTRPLGRGVSRRLAVALGLALGLSATAARAQAPTIYGLGTLSQTVLPLSTPFFPAGAAAGTQGLLLINPATGNALGVPTLITGVAAGQTLVGIDSRPNTGQLFGLGYDPSTGDARLYTIVPATGVATAVGTGPVALALGSATDRIGFDFNPTVDRIRVEGSTNRNYRLNPNSGAVTNDLNLNYATPNAALDPFVGTVAYTNSYAGSTATTLYALDEAGTGTANNGFLSVQMPPNDGVLTAPQAVTLGANAFGNPLQVDVDVYFNPTTGLNEAYLSEVTTRAANGRSSSNFYRLNLGTGAATLLANTVPNAATSPFDIIDIAAGIAPLTQPALTGQLVYAVAGGNLISFDSDAPGTIRSAVNITGLPSAAGVAQVLVGTDFRPATGELFALGYNAGNATGQLYTLNLSTGALAAVGSLNAYPLGATAANIGFDFNPTVDRIRVVSATNQANLRVNPADGVIATDIALNNPAGTPAISGVAYTNNDNNASRGTTLYGYDQARNVLLRSTNANGGVYVDQGPTGLAVNTNGVDFDVFTDNTSGANSAFAAAGPTGSTADNLYAVNLTTGAFASQGRIGNGSNLSGLAVLLTPAAAANLLTWTGLVSTDYGTAGNWNPQAVPTATSNVLIPSGPANQPSVGTAQAARAVTIDAGATLLTATGGTLAVAGNLTNNGTLDGSGTGTVAFNGTVAQAISGAGSTRFRNLTVGNAAGVSTSGPAAVQSALTLNGLLAIGSGQPFTLLSDATGSAFVVQNAGGSTTGQATVQRYITPTNAGLGYRHYAAPVTGSTVADLTTAGFTPDVSQGAAYNASATPGTVTPFPNVFFYNQARVGTVTSDFSDFDKGWQAPTSLGDPLLVGRGYTVNIAGTAKVDFVGTLNGGNLTLGGLARGTSAESGWHLLGNPYPSALNWNLVRDNNLSNIADALYVFKSSGQYSGTYAAYVNGIGTSGGTNVLPLGQGFFVRATSNTTPGQVGFEDNQRLASATDNNVAFQRPAADLRPLLVLGLRSATASQQTAVYFEAGATAAADDRRYDASALPTTNGLTLATEAGTTALAINGLPALLGQDVRVPLRLAGPSGQYALTTDQLLNLPAAYRAYLLDARSGQATELRAAAVLPLTLAAAAPATGRYSLLFSTQPRVALATAPAQLAALASLAPNPARGSVTLTLPAALRGTSAVPVQIIDGLGRLVRTATLGTGAETLTLALQGLAPGVYAVQARTAAGLVTKRLVVE